jgi:hypothetical protein
MLAGPDPIGVVFYRDDETRGDLLELCGLLAPVGIPLRRTAAISDAFTEADKGTLLLVVLENPIAEMDAIRTLEGRREKLLDREAPALVFLMQGGSAEDILNRDAPAISSFLRGLTYDPEPPPNLEDLAERRVSFEKEHGRTPDEWLASFRRDEIEDNAENNLTAHEAWVLRTS